MPTIDVSELNIIIAVLGIALTPGPIGLTADLSQAPLQYSMALGPLRSNKYGT